MKQKSKAYRLMKSVLWVLILGVFFGYLMYKLGDWEDHNWVIFSTAIFSIVYHVHRIYFKKNQTNSGLTFLD